MDLTSKGIRMPFPRRKLQINLRLKLLPLKLNIILRNAYQKIGVDKQEGQFHVIIRYNKLRWRGIAFFPETPLFREILTRRRRRHHNQLTIFFWMQRHLELRSSGIWRSMYLTQLNFVLNSTIRFKRHLKWLIK